MKRLIFAIAFLGFCLGRISSAGAEVIEATSKISAATVYPGSAHVTRSVTLDLQPGDHTVVFEKINPPLDENTLSVSGEGEAAVKIYGGYIKQEFVKKNPDARAADIEAKIQDLDDQTAERNSDSQVLDQKKEYLNSVKLFSGGQLPKDLVTTMPSVDHLKGVGDYLAAELGDIEKQKNEIRIKLRDIAKERAKLTLQLNSLRSTEATGIVRKLAVDLACVKPGKFTLNVSYLVNGAFWRPIYDARTDITKSEVDFTAFGMVKQNTGEDWEDVALTLSTAKPNIGGRMPYVSPWVITGYLQNQSKGIFESRARDAAPALATIGSGSQYEPYYSQTQYNIGDETRQDIQKRKENKFAEIAYSQVAQNGLSVTFRIPRPVSLKSDGSENKFPIATQTLKSDFEYSGFPKAAELSYLGSEVVNSKDLQMLAGEVNLFLEGNFIGKSDIQNVGPGEKFSLYLGVNENIKVKREQLDKKVDDIMIAGIPSPNRTTTFKMKIKIENYENRKIKYNLFESMPTTQNDKQIKIRVFDVNPEPAKKDWDDRKGVWQWVVELEPKAKKEIVYTYSVEAPRDMIVNGI